MTERQHWTVVEPTPVGPLMLSAEDGALVGLRFGVSEPAAPGRRDDDDYVLSAARRELAEYFAGERRSFTVPLAPGGTPFQRSVWDQLALIPYGTTISYGELARRVGDARASRAVGLANGRNPIVIILPCHRVIGANGSLTGFGAGIAIKRTLLDLESGTLV